MSRQKTRSGYSQGRWQTRADYKAQCQTCSWSKDTGSSRAGSDHARAERHCVTIIVEHVKIYNFEPLPVVPATMAAPGAATERP